MKASLKILFALIVLATATAGCGLETSSAPGAGEPTAIDLEPYASDQFGFAGIVPAGWDEFSPGHFQPERPGKGPTLFAQFALPGEQRDQLVERAGLPDRQGSLGTPNLNWDLYATPLKLTESLGIDMEVALAEESGRVYAVLLASAPADHASQREALFLPALEALQPSLGTATDPEPKPAATLPSPPPADSQPIRTRERPADGMVMVYVPAGDFVMGNDKVWRWSGSFPDNTVSLQVLIDQQPQHTVYLDAYWIDQTEVTVAMFRAFVEATGYVTTAEREGYAHPYRPGPKEQEWPRVPGADWQHPKGPGSDAKDDHPVVQVSWDDAAAYCAWAGGGLPTEAEWEKACRGTGGRLYPWGDLFDESRLNHCDASCPVTRWEALPAFDDGYAYTSPAGHYPSGASPYGALDMAGNVWEWTADRYDAEYYADSPRENPSGPETGTERVQHGGAWFDVGGAGWLACTIRHATRAGTTCDDLGFRCALPAGEGSP
jgi:formylglycine-generating enzyme required for sulfatase activity